MKWNTLSITFVVFLACGFCFFAGMLVVGAAWGFTSMGTPHAIYYEHSPVPSISAPVLVIKYMDIREHRMHHLFWIQEHQSREQLEALGFTIRWHRQENTAAVAPSVGIDLTHLEDDSTYRESFDLVHPNLEEPATYYPAIGLLTWTIRVNFDD